MATELLSSGVLGVLAILLLGGLLALGAAFLPRLLKLEELVSEARWGMGGGPKPLEQAEPPPSPERESAIPVLPSRESLAARLGTEGEDPLVAAAIALALTLYQQGPRPTQPGETTFRAGSAWALSGRWQAMQARINRQMR